MQNPPSVVADDEKTIEDTERQHRHGEEIHCSDCFAMVPEKSQPAPRWIRITGRTLHPARDGSFRDVET
jgi:hypothetical protein